MHKRYAHYPFLNTVRSTYWLFRSQLYGVKSKIFPISCQTGRVGNARSNFAHPDILFIIA